MKPLLLAAVSSLALLLGPSNTGRGQYPPPPYNYYYPPGGARGNALTGAANVVSATGDLYVQQEQARIQREKANQAKIDTKRKAFDEAAYEKANTPSFTEEQVKIDATVLRRLIDTPREWEITSGYALNKIVPYVNLLASQGVMGPPIPVDPHQLQSINVRVGGENNLGAFKNGGNLDWPIVLQGPLQKEVDKILPQAVSQAASGTLDPKTYRQVKEDVGKIRDDLSKQFRAEKIDGGEYLTGKRFLETVDQAVQAIAKPGAKKVLDGSYAPRGNNVPEVAYSMTSQGLQFAPATAGAEGPYYALHSAFAAYARAAQGSNGFQARLGTPTGTSSAQKR